MAGIDEFLLVPLRCRQLTRPLLHPYQLKIAGNEHYELQHPTDRRRSAVFMVAHLIVVWRARCS